MTRGDVEVACESLVADGRLDFLRGGDGRRYVLPPHPNEWKGTSSRRTPSWLSAAPPSGHRFGGATATGAGHGTAATSTGTAEQSAERSASNYQFVENRPEKYWRWYRVALYLLFSLDILTTLWATAIYGTDAEVNPIMVWLIEQGIVATVAVNLLALVVVVFAFSWVLTAIRSAPDPFDIVLEIVVEAWLGVLVLVGLFVAANNAAVILLGRSLV